MGNNYVCPRRCVVIYANRHFALWEIPAGTKIMVHEEISEKQKKTL